MWLSQASRASDSESDVASTGNKGGRRKTDAIGSPWPLMARMFVFSPWCLGTGQSQCLNHEALPPWLGTVN
jgi:hypothetical protein